MSRPWNAFPPILVAALLAAGAATAPAAAKAPVPGVVTADIQAGIERYVEQQVAKGGGYFDLPYGEGVLRLKLVKVHTEYLSNLGPRRHFACVDLVDTKGDVYDVDFFLKGDPGDMTVTETTVHKLNGQPFYAWEQQADKSWRRIPVEDASDVHFGVVKGSDAFVFLYRATLPEFTGSARMWLPLPASDDYQYVETVSIDVPGKRRILRDAKEGNKVLYLELEEADAGSDLELRFSVTRNEKAAYEEPRADLATYLAPEALVPTGGEFESIAREVVAGKRGDLVRARALYDHVIDRMGYKKAAGDWGRGDAVYACDARSGNCTDFHSYFIALARSVGIPARFAIGAAVPSSRNEGGVDGYHCWAEFFAEGKWWPVDISEADKYSSLATYYFGHHPANRLEFSRGRDLVLDPGPASGPINFLAYPVLEVNGEPVKAKVSFSFERKSS